jgi:hypothetical protein
MTLMILLACASYNIGKLTQHMFLYYIWEHLLRVKSYFDSLFTIVEQDPKFQFRNPKFVVVKCDDVSHPLPRLLPALN